MPTPTRRPTPRRKAKAAHHRGTYHVRSRALTAAARANPNTRCWRCGNTMAEIRTRYPRAKWTAGHLNDGQVGGPLAPECSRCNYSAGASAGNRARTTNKRTNLSW